VARLSQTRLLCSCPCLFLISTLKFLLSRGIDLGYELPCNENSKTYSKIMHDATVLMVQKRKTTSFRCTLHEKQKRKRKKKSSGHAHAISQYFCEIWNAGVSLFFFFFLQCEQRAYRERLARHDSIIGASRRTRRRSPLNFLFPPRLVVAGRSGRRVRLKWQKQVQGRAWYFTAMGWPVRLFDRACMKFIVLVFFCETIYLWRRTCRYRMEWWYGPRRWAPCGRSKQVTQVGTTRGGQRLHLFFFFLRQDPRARCEARAP
jgi:hypothetical protein